MREDSEENTVTYGASCHGRTRGTFIAKTDISTEGLIKGKSGLSLATVVSGSFRGGVLS